MPSFGSKLDVRPILSANRRTISDARTGKIRTIDILELVAFPATVGTLSFVAGWRLRSPDALLAATGLLGAFLFGLMIRELEYTEDLAEGSRAPSRALSDQARIVTELSANAAYAALVSFALAGLLIVGNVAMSASAPRWFTALTMVGMTHLGMVMVLLVRRVFTRIGERLTWARSGASREDD
jgi:hypothetical protein